MKEEKINDDDFVKDVIANSPEVTHEQLDEEPIKEGVILPPAQIDTQQAERDSSILRTGFSSAYEQFSGENFNDNQQYMLSAFGRELFEAIQANKMNPFVRLGLLSICCAIPFVPLIFKFIKAGKA